MLEVIYQVFGHHRCERCEKHYHCDISGAVGYVSADRCGALALRRLLLFVALHCGGGSRDSLNRPSLWGLYKSAFFSQVFHSSDNNAIIHKYNISIIILKAELESFIIIKREV